jgi:hypothetical protein
MSLSFHYDLSWPLLWNCGLKMILVMVVWAHFLVYILS